MASRVEIAPQALADLDGIADYIMEHGGFEQAEKWFNSIIDALASLQDMPARFQTFFATPASLGMEPKS